ncbi:hypothetical protein [Streptomyces sp. 7-21]|jgi:hypothetical protein|uniref:hypothetical protein n=1 Tax=Streptomyces sp. 7-21 TaxID=2802283 RepID=UPI001920091D|nr:hypothetical protein [Streptomyces sp. 7-21]MBL1068434.1 hypothetical protein [Streptomyces sp. 7-21]
MAQTADSSDPRSCDLVTVPAREGLEAVDILRLRACVGPVFHDRDGGTLGFIVPPGTAERWDLPGSACVRTLFGDLPAAAPPVTGSGWLVPPDGTRAPATEPERLRAALREASRTLAVVDSCQ